MQAGEYILGFGAYGRLFPLVWGITEMTEGIQSRLQAGAGRQGTEVRQVPSLLIQKEARQL